jgi:hypothetical protein
MTRDVSPGIRLASTHEVHDFDAVTFVHECVREERPPEDLEVVFDRHAARVDRKLCQQVSDRKRLVEFEQFAVERDAQGVGPRNASAYRAAAEVVKVSH